jgi:competence ComEA-like helix-hairpin-helix protein
MQSRHRTKRSILLITLFLASLSALAAAESRPVVNVNTADAKQLSLLPRVGLALGERIVDYRKQNGPFKTTDELMLVRGVGEKLYAQLKPYLATSGETTLEEKVAGPGRDGKAKGAPKGSSRSRSKSGSRSASAAPPKAPRAPHARRPARSTRASRASAPAAIARTAKTAGVPR